MKKNEPVCGVSESGVDVSMAETTSSFEGHRPSRFSAKPGAKRWYGRALALSLTSVSLLATVACGTSDEEVVDEAAGRQTASKRVPISLEGPGMMEALRAIGVPCSTFAGVPRDQWTGGISSLNCEAYILVCGIRKDIGIPGCSYKNDEQGYRKGRDDEASKFVYEKLKEIAEEENFPASNSTSYTDAYYVADVFFGMHADGEWYDKEAATLVSFQANSGNDGNTQPPSNNRYLCFAGPNAASVQQQAETECGIVYRGTTTAACQGNASCVTRDRSGNYAPGIRCDCLSRGTF
jgi:hypothetical protein